MLRSSERLGAVYIKAGLGTDVRESMGSASSETKSSLQPEAHNNMM